MSPILIIDNYDSFTYNLVHMVNHITGAEADVYRNDEITLDKVDQGRIMAIRHKEYRLCGVQFHPESVLTEYGKELMTNWLNSYIYCFTSSCKFKNLLNSAMQLAR